MEALKSEDKYYTNGKKRIAHTSNKNAETVAKTKKTLTMYQSKHRSNRIEQRFIKNNISLESMRKVLTKKRSNASHQINRNAHQATTNIMTTHIPNKDQNLKKILTLNSISTKDVEIRQEERLQDMVYNESQITSLYQESVYISSSDDETVQPAPKKARTSNDTVE